MPTFLHADPLWPVIKIAPFVEIVVWALIIFVPSAMLLLWFPIVADYAS